VIDDEVDQHRATCRREHGRTSLTAHHHHVTDVVLTTHTQQQINDSHCHAKTTIRRLLGSERIDQTAIGLYGWRLGVVVSVVGRINEVNQHRARLVHDG